MPQRTISSKMFVDKLRQLYWQILQDHLKYIERLHNSEDTVEEQQRFQQEKIAIQDVASVFPEAYIDLFYLDSLFKSRATNELPEQDPEFSGKELPIKLDDLVNRIRNRYWEALVAKKEWEDEPGGKEFLKRNHNYDYRLGGFRKVFAIFDLGDYSKDLDDLIKKLHYRMELNSYGAHEYIQFDPETGEDITDPIYPKKIELDK